MKHYGDIKTLRGDLLEPVSCIIGGSPCQGLSVAGNRKGLTDERSALFLEMIRIIKEMQEATNGRYPQYAIWENVEHSLGSNSGKDFRCVLEQFVRIKEPGASIPMPKKWNKSGIIIGDGWSIAWRLLDARGWGVPQRRKRIALVFSLRNECAANILFEKVRMSGYSRQSEVQGENTSLGGFESIEQHNFGSELIHTYCLQGSMIGRAIKNGPQGSGINKDTCFTLNTIDKHAVCTTDSVDGPIARRLTPTEWERLQGFPNGWTDIGEWFDENGKKHKPADSPRYKALGNSIALPQWEWILTKMSPYVTNPTLGSLFDGISGFPFVFEKVYGNGTAKWGCEIDGFCNAVSIKHFPDD